jgi:hypothetical protein
MPLPLSGAVPALAVGAQQPLHPNHQVGQGCFQQNVEMIAHQNPRMHTPSAHSAGLTKPVEENLAVIVGLKHHLPSVATSHDMVNRPWILKTPLPSHHLRQPPGGTGSSYNCDTAGTDPSNVKKGDRVDSDDLLVKLTVA